MTTQITYFDGLPTYDVNTLLTAAFDNGVLSGSGTQVTLTYLDLVVTFTGSGLSTSGSRTLTGGQITSILFEKSGVDLLSATGYSTPIPYTRVQQALTFFDTVANPTSDQILDVSAALFLSEPTQVNGSGAADVLFGGDLVVTDIFGNGGNDYIQGGDAGGVRSGGSGDDVINGGAGDDWMIGGAGNDSFWGGPGGWDNISYIDEGDGTDGTGIIFDWNTGTSTDSAGFTDIFDATSIDSVHGTNDADTFIGNGADNTFHGYGGNDYIDGGGGNDWVHYHGEVNHGGLANTGVTINLAAGSATDSYGATDTLVSIENAEGTDFVDVITGSDGDNELRGLGGADTISGGLGSDFIDGGQGNDTIHGGGIDDVDGYDNLEYYEAETAITVTKTSRSAGSVTGTWSGTDTFDGIEIVVGSRFADTFNGSSQNDDFTGMAGADTFNGNGGIDTVVYEKERTGFGVIVNLSGSSVSDGVHTVLAGRALDAFGDTDTLNSIENVVGTREQDLLVGGAGVNFLYGGDGRDWLFGGDGADHLFGGDRGDYLVGGQGNDIIDGGGAQGQEQDRVDYWMEQNGAGLAVTVNLLSGTAIDTFGNTDTLLNLTEASGTAGNDTFTGGPGYNGFRGFLGADTFINTPDGSGHVWVYYGQDDDYGATQGLLANLSDQNLFGVGAEAGFAPTNLAANSAKDGFGSIDTFVHIHNIRGTAQADWLMGSDQSDFLQMAAGDDYINGGGGEDVVDYGHDIDEGAPNRGVVINLSDFDLTGIDIGLPEGPVNVAAHRALDGFGDTDTVVNVEGGTGTLFNDYIVGGHDRGELTGRDGDDIIISGDSNDYIDAGAGNDTIYAIDNGPVGYGDYILVGTGDNVIIAQAVYNPDGFRDGHDLSFQDIQSGVTASLVSGFGFANGMTVTFSEVHFLIGSGFDDVLLGGVTDFDGFEGYTGNAGDDYIDGGSGWDRVDYGNELDGGYFDAFGDAVLGFQGVTVDLAAHTATDSFGDHDTLDNIEAVRGTRLADNITGSATDNELEGEDGDDTLTGGGGGNTLTGGADQDSFRFLVRDHAIDTVTDFVAADDTLVFATSAFDFNGAAFDSRITAATTAVDITGADLVIWTGGVLNTAADVQAYLAAAAGGSAGEGLFIAGTNAGGQAVLFHTTDASATVSTDVDFITTLGTLTTANSIQLNDLAFV